MKTNTNHYFNVLFCFLSAFLTIAIFTSCGENSSGSGGVMSSKDYEAIADQARRVISEHQYSTAASMLQDGAQNGHVRSQRYLGVCLLMLDREVEGASWIRRAAEAGDEVSQFNIAKCYNYGIGVKASIEEVRFWSQKLEDSGWEGVALAMTFGGRNFKLEK